MQTQLKYYERKYIKIDDSEMTVLSKGSSLLFSFLDFKIFEMSIKEVQTLAICRTWRYFYKYT